MSIRPRISLLFATIIVAGLSSSPKAAHAQSTYVGAFAITNISTDKALTTSSTAFSGAEEVTDPWAAISGQEWAFFRLPNGFYAIMNAKTTQFLYTPTGLGAAGGPSVSEAKWSASLSQMWYLYSFGNNVYAMVNVQSGMMLADPNNATSSGNPVEVTQWAAKPNQIWYLYYLGF
jgi:hypothetical protein